MPNKMVYSTISAEILRICRATKGFINFSLDISDFFLRMKRQVAKIEGVRLSIKELLDDILIPSKSMATIKNKC